MEQKKTLWIIAASCVFLLVVFGGALIVFNKDSLSSGKIATTQSIKTQEQSGWTKTSPTDTSLTEISSPQVNDMFVVSANTTVLDLSQPEEQSPEYTNEPTTIDLNSLKKELVTEASMQQPQNINITVNLTEKDNQKTVTESPVVVHSEYYTGKSKEAEAIEKSTAVKNVESNVTQTTTVAKKSQTTSSSNENKSSAKSTSTKTTAASTQKATPITRYWVQVAAYSNKKTAENARNTLSDKKINSDIYTYEDNKSKLFYRVRVGPFTTKSEAEYWQSKIVEISDFAKSGSYVTSTTD